MNNIKIKQNNEEFIRLLKAQRVAHSSAKNHQWIDVVAILCAVLQTIFTVLNYSLVLKYLSIFSGIWVVVVIFSELYRVKQIKAGAIIQEAFDVKLFEIPQNKVLVPEFLNTIRVIELSNSYKKDDLKDWFSKENDGKLSREQGILLTYKENCIWGIVLRKQFIKLVIIGIVAYFIVAFGIIIYNFKNIDDIIYSIVPSAPFWVFTSHMLKNLLETKNKYEELDKVVDTCLEKQVDDIVIRQIQDLFFLQRCNPVDVPNWFYRIKQKKLNRMVDEIIKITKTKINQNG